MSLQVSLVGLSGNAVTFANPFMNAAGVMCSNEEDLTKLDGSTSGSFITKSCTLEPREGNPEPRFQALPLGSINSMGLPNLGYDFYEKWVASRGKGDGKKPVFFSMSGMSKEDNVNMAKRLAALAEQQLCILELNLSCPNVPGKPQVGYEFDTMEEYIQAVTAVYPHPFGVKLPPYFDIAHFDRAASILNKYPNVKFLTSINSIGNGLVVDVDSETVVIKPKNGFGGIGGQYVLPTALANVNAFYTRCPEKLIFGCGGIACGRDAFAHVLAGASMLQIGTQLWTEGPAVFDRVQKELLELMASKGYKTLEDFRGKLKVIE